ncbi:MAG: outer membrane protein transport protein [Bryobacteraceae bacterium]
MRARFGLRLFLLLTPAVLSASSFSVNELGARAQGMGGAFLSIADDGSALFFNPAGIAFLKKTNFQMEALAINGQFRFTPNPDQMPPGTAVPAKGFSGAIHQPFIPVPSMYMTRRINDKWAAGFAVYIPNGLGDNWTNFNDSDPFNTKFVGRFAGSRAQLQQYWFQPTVAYRISPNQAISLGIAFVHTHLFLEESFLNPYDTKPTSIGFSLASDVFPGVDPQLAYNSFVRLLPEGRLRAAATANKYGVSLGYLYKHRASGINFGLTYRSHVVSHLQGQASFAFAGPSALVPFLPADRGLSVVFPNQAIRGTFTTPDNYGVGVSKRGVMGGTLAVDFHFMQFSRFKDLPLNFTKNFDSKGRPTGTDPEQRLTFDFTNSVMVQTGYERPFGSGGPKMLSGLTKDSTWRAGYIFDQSPVPDKSKGPLFPDTSRHSVTAGITKSIGNKDFTVFYQYMKFTNVTTDVLANQNQFTNGTYKSIANLIGLGLRWRAGGQDATAE